MAKSNDEMMPHNTPKRKEESNWNIRSTPINVSELCRSSLMLNLCLLMIGDTSAVKNPDRQKHTTPIDTLANLILA